MIIVKFFATLLWRARPQHPSVAVVSVHQVLAQPFTGPAVRDFLEGHLILPGVLVVDDEGLLDVVD